MSDYGGIIALAAAGGKEEIWNCEFGLWGGERDAVALLADVCYHGGK